MADEAWPQVVHAERIIVRFLSNLQLIQRRRRVVFSQAHDAVLVEIGENEPRITQMVLMEILRPVPCYLPASVLRHHTAVRRINGLQFPVVVLDARGVARRSEFAVFAPFVAGSVAEQLQ